MTTEGADQLLHGLRIRSGVRLHAAARAPGQGDPDVVLRVGQPLAVVADDAPPGEPIASAAAQGRRLYSASRSGGGVTTFRVHGVAEFQIDAEGGHVLGRAGPGYTTEHLGILFSGTIISFLLAQRGLLVLHGSAVRVPEGPALGIVGTSGMGKSTLAGLFCAAGAQLVSDDVLPVDIDGPGPAAVVGSAGELRLRDGSRPVADLFVDAPRRATADGRVAIAPGRATVERSPIGAIITPRRRQGTGDIQGDVQVSRLPAMAALRQLISFPRILVWHDRGIMAQQFHLASRLAETTALYVVSLRWATPVDPALPERILQEISLG